MLVSHRKKFIFLKTSKTAGTSVEVFFEKYCFPEGDWIFSHYIEEYINSDTGIVGYRGLSRSNQRFYNHIPAYNLREELGNDIWDKYFKFTVIRNPFDKMVSAFFHFEKHRKLDTYSSDKLTDVERFRNWVKGGGKVIDKHIYSIEGKVAVDYVIRYENLRRDLESVCKKINLDFDSNDLPNLKSEFRDRSLPAKAFYDLETEQLVRKSYDFEIQHFGYELE
ncbi:sulfotransferase family protein [Paraglaciecola sp.]|nr:sulfotransferase family protein [Paraglaciecola sp.]